MLQKWTEGPDEVPEILLLHQKCARSASVTPEVLLSHQKCFCHTRSASTKPKVFPPNRKCFSQTGSAPKLLPPNWRCTKSASTEPEGHQKCFRQTGSAPKVLLPKQKCTQIASVAREVPPSHGSCRCHTGGAFTGWKVPPPHGMCLATYVTLPHYRCTEGDESTVGALEIDRRSRRCKEGDVSFSQHTRNATAASEVDRKCHCQTGN